MNRKRMNSRKQRNRIFLGCEGKAEYFYALWLKWAVTEELNLHVHIDAHELGGGALDKMVRVAADKRHRLQKVGAYKHSFILFDRDRYDRDAEEGRRAEIDAASARISLVWQRPCSECFILLHCREHRDAPVHTKTVALQIIQDLFGQLPPIPHYVLRKHLEYSPDAFESICKHAEGLRTFLVSIGILKK